MSCFMIWENGIYKNRSQNRKYIYSKRILLNFSLLTFSGKFPLLDSDRIPAPFDLQRYVAPKLFNRGMVSHCAKGYFFNG